MKKTITCILLISILCIALLTACSDENEKTFSEQMWNSPDYKTLGTVTNLSAKSIFREVIKAKENTPHKTNSMREFICDTIGLENNQNEIYRSYQLSNSYYKENIIQGSGMVARKLSGYGKFYYDGTSFYNYKDQRSQTVDLFIDKIEADMSKLESYTYEEYYDNYIKFSSYLFDDEYLSDSHEDTVYELKNNYYFIITLKTKGNEGKQAAVETVIAKSINASGSSFAWITDTIIKCEVSVINNKMLLSARRMEEQYSGKISGLAGNCSNITAATYDYSPFEIPKELLTIG